MTATKAITIMWLVVGSLLSQILSDDSFDINYVKNVDRMFIISCTCVVQRTLIATVWKCSLKEQKWKCSGKLTIATTFQETGIRQVRSFMILLNRTKKFRVEHTSPANPLWNFGTLHPISKTVKLRRFLKRTLCLKPQKRYSVKLKFAFARFAPTYKHCKTLPTTGQMLSLRSQHFMFENGFVTWAAMLIK